MVFLASFTNIFSSSSRDEEANGSQNLNSISWPTHDTASSIALYGFFEAVCITEVIQRKSMAEEKEALRDVISTPRHCEVVGFQPASSCSKAHQRLEKSQPPQH